MIKNYIPVILVFALIAGCAKINAPSGGPKDREAPVVVKSVPPDGMKNFRGNRIAITFNEYVTLDKINEKFMVSPPMKKKPDVSMRGKSVVIDFDEKLKDSTTYTFYFQDAIRDLNEGNIINNFQFVFSTGPVIDSLSVTGNVYQAFTLDPPEETLVLLYRELADSAFRKHLPEYISRPEKSGYFRIDNVRPGRYRLYALKDKDNSKNYNLPDEEIAFLDSPIEVNPEKNYLPVIIKKDSVPKAPPKILTTKTLQRTTQPIDTVVKQGEYKLILFQGPKKAHYLTGSSRNSAYRLVYTLSLPPDSMKFDLTIPGAGKNSFIVGRNRENDTMTVWLTDSTLFKQPQLVTLLNYPFTDSTGITRQKEDTVRLRFIVPKAPRARPRRTPFRFNSSLMASNLKPGQKIVFSASTPFRNPDTSKIRLYEIIEKTKRVSIPFSFRKDSSDICRMLMNANLSEGKSYFFVAYPAAIGNIYGEVSDSTGNRFMVRGEDSFGSLLLNVSNYQGDRIIQLLTEDEKIVRQTIMKSDGKTDFKYLDQADYKLRVIYDLNNDGKWTTGDFTIHRQPEPVSFYNQVLRVKEGWKMDQDWDISQQNVKKIKLPVKPGTGLK